MELVTPRRCTTPGRGLRLVGPPGLDRLVRTGGARSAQQRLGGRAALPALGWLIVSTSPAPPPARRPAARSPKAPSRRTWALSLGGAAAVIVALMMFVNAQDHTANRPAGVTSPGAIAEQNREDTLVVRQDQAPRVLAVRHGPADAGALRSAVVRYMRGQIASGAIGGPLMGSRCTPAVGSTEVRLVLRCRVVAANETYPFLGVVDTRRRLVTYCKRDYPPVPSMNIPVSRRCT